MTTAAEYWKGRAADLINTYDHPETWSQRDGWYDDKLERRTVPLLLHAHRAHSALIVGCAAGRQYAFLQPHGLELSGLDFSPMMVATCRERYPTIRTELDDITNPRHDWQADAVLCTHVLQNIPPDQIDAAVANVARSARKLIILRELAWLDDSAAPHQWGRNYPLMLPGWIVAFAAVMDESAIHRTELTALRHPGPWSPSAP